jgi:hypothetical protein
MSASPPAAAGATSPRSGSRTSGIAAPVATHARKAALIAVQTVALLLISDAGYGVVRAFASEGITLGTTLLVSAVIGIWVAGLTSQRLARGTREDPQRHGHPSSPSASP